MKKMNFLIFMVDQMQSFSLGCNGNTQVKTPNLDELASEGVSFRRAYCPNPTCMPSRSSFITGLTPKQHGCITNGTNLPETIPTIPEVLHQKGYRTYCGGKFHFQATANSNDPSFGMAVSAESKAEWDSMKYDKLPCPYYGFYETDFVGGHGHGNFGAYTNWLRKEHSGVWDQYQPQDFIKTGSLTIDIPPELHYNHWIADKTIDFLATVSDENFFAVCSFPDPHAPFSACRKYVEMYPPDEMKISETFGDCEDSLPFLQERRSQFGHTEGCRSKRELQELQSQTYGMISHIDENIGRVLKKLKEKGLHDSTVICFVADHGEYLGCHNLLGKSEWLYEELVRVPFIVKVPDGFRQKTCDEVVRTLDFSPTILKLANLPMDSLQVRNQGHARMFPLPGQDMTGYLLKNKPFSQDFAVIEFDEDWHSGPHFRERVIVTEQYKLIIFAGMEGGMLFDLISDPKERNNLYFKEEFAEIKGVLTRKLLDYLVTTERMDLPRPVAY